MKDVNMRRVFNMTTYNSASDSLRPGQLDKLCEKFLNPIKLFFLCKCGEEIEGNKNTNIYLIVCPKCKRKGQVEELPF